MSNPWFLDVKNGGFEEDSCFQGDDRAVSIASKDKTVESIAISRSSEVPIEIDKTSERQNGEGERTYDVDGNVDIMTSTENERQTVPGFVENGTMDTGSPSREWVMSAGELGQILLEMPNTPIDGYGQLSARQVKAELRDVESSGSNLLDVCNPRVPLKQSVMGGVLDSLAKTDFTLFDCSSDKSFTRSCDQSLLKLDDPNLFHIIEIVPQKHPLGIDIGLSEKNILEQMSQSSDLQTTSLTTMKNELYDSSTLQLQTVAFDKLLSVTNTSTSNQCFPEECFSVANFENVIDVNASSGTESQLCPNIDVSSVSYNNDVLPLCQPRSCKLNEDAISSADQCSLKSDTGLSVMDFFLETSVLIKDGYESEIKRQILTYGAGDILPSTFKDYFSSDCVNVVTSSPDAGFKELHQSGSQKPLPVNVLSVVGIGNLSESVATKVPTTANGSGKMHSKQLNIDNNKFRSSSKSSITAFGRSGTDVASKKKIVLFKGTVVDQQSVVLPDVAKIKEGEEVDDCDQTESKKFVCSQEDCAWSFPTAYKLKRHEETHEGRKDFMCSVDGCNKHFTTIYNLKTHLRLHKLPCTEVCPQPNCTQTFRNKRMLDKHMKLHSNGEKTYKCPHPGCTKTFFSQTSIGSHARVHQHDSELICAFDGCGRKFDKLCRLKQHMRCHTGERPYRCTVEGCNWAFSTSSRLCRHLQMHNGQKKWSCPFDGCSKLFTRAEHVRGHLVTHSSQRPFMCINKGCDARFKSKNSLDIHLKRHSQMDKKPPKGVLFYCPHEDCSHKFSTKAQLRAHIDSHEQRLSSADHSHRTSSVVEHLPVMVNLELENLERIVHSRRRSSSSSSSAAGDHSLFLGTRQPAEVRSTNHVPTTSLNLLTLPVFVASEPSAINSSSLTTFLSGPARTDFTSYHLVNQRAVLKWQDQHCDSLDTGLLNIGHLKDMASVSSEPLHCLSEQMTPGVMLNADEIMTSHAITFRDPETGTIYVQTQLMQDDPPSTNVYLDDDGSSGLHLESSMDQTPVLAPDLSSMLDNDCNDFNDDDDAFTGTTINLQDLE